MKVSGIRSPTTAEIKSFQADGVVCLRKAVSSSVIGDMKHSIDRLTAQTSYSPAGYDLENLGDVAFSDTEQINYGHAKQYDLELFAGWLRYEGNPRSVDEVPANAPKGSFLLDTGCWRRDKSLASIATSWNMGKLAAQLLASPQIAFYDDQMFVKRPGTKQKTAWHQDYPFFHLKGNQGLVIWISVDPVTSENGGMRYIRGSHKWRTNFGAGMFISRTLMPGAPGEMVPDIDANPHKYDIISYDIEPGDILIHHFKTVHGSSGNKSLDKDRRAMSLRYVGADMRFHLRAGAPIPPHLTCHLSEGDPIWCDDYPLIYGVFQDDSLEQHEEGPFAQIL